MDEAVDYYMVFVEEQLEELRNFKAWELERMVQTDKWILFIHKKICTLEVFHESGTRAMGAYMQSPNDKRSATMSPRPPSSQVGKQDVLDGDHYLPITPSVAVGNASAPAK